MSLQEKVKRYYEIKKQIDDLTSLKDSLGEEIKDMLVNEPDKNMKIMKDIQRDQLTE